MTMKKRVMPIILTMLTVFAMMPMTAGAVYAKGGDPAMNPGTAVLDQNVSTNKPESIWYADAIWHVIGFDGSGAASVHNAATLLSEGSFGTTRFDDKNQSNAYANSMLRKKIEGYEEGGSHVDGVLDRFSDAEQGAVMTRTLVHGNYSGSDTDCIAGDTDLTDVVLWPLSPKEAKTVNLDLRIFDPEHIDWASNFWWLRSPSQNDTKAVAVSGGGALGYKEGYILTSEYAVRPAFYLKLKSVLFTSAAEGGKSSGPVGADGLKAQSGLTNSGNVWKVTVKDRAHAGFSVSKATLTGKGMSVKYKGAVTGTNEYISAIITDKPITKADAAIRYYGRIAAASAGNDASVTINTANKLGKNDHLYVFSEQYNGDKKTDYASELIEVTAGNAKVVTAVTVDGSTVSTKAIDKAFRQAGASKDTVTTIVLGKNVRKIDKSVFKNFRKTTTLVVKSKKLKKSKVKRSLTGSRITKVKVQIGSKKVNKKYVKKYKKIFTKKNAGKKVNVTL